MVSACRHPKTCTEAVARETHRRSAFEVTSCHNQIEKRLWQRAVRRHLGAPSKNQAPELLPRPDPLRRAGYIRPRRHPRFISLPKAGFDMRDLGAILDHNEPLLQSRVRFVAVASTDHQRSAVMRRCDEGGTFRLSNSRHHEGPLSLTSLNCPPCCSLRCPLCSTLRTYVGHRAESEKCE